MKNFIAAAVLFSLAPIAQADHHVTLDAPYMVIARVCDDGSPAIDRPITFFEGATLVYGSDGKMTVKSQKIGEITTRYRIEGNTLININLTSGKEVHTQIFVSGDSVRWVSPLPKDAAIARTICATGDNMTTVFRLR